MASGRVLQPEFGATLPVLLYHHVGPAQPSTYPQLTVAPARFERHIRWLVRHGYQGIAPSSLLAWRSEGAALPGRAVLITFDDGYADIAEYALPILRRYGFKAGVYIVSGRIGCTNQWDEEQGAGTHRLLGREQIHYWAERGVEFGGHSRSHQPLITLDHDGLVEEVAGCAGDLRQILGIPPCSFAYPYAIYNSVVRECVSQYFPLAFTCDEGLNNLQTDPLLLRRTTVSPSDSWIALACRLRLGYSPIQRIRFALGLRTRVRRLMKVAKGTADTRSDTPIRRRG
jgi:peptidoglycan/xylan/chitin deacetylase (PgdA/CDA1 family)